MPRRIGYIINPAAGSGTGGARWRGLAARLESLGLGGEVRQSQGPGAVVGIATDLARRCEVVVAVGGDGTAMEAATGLVSSGSGASLAILPLGSGNDSARLVGTGRLEDALAALSAGRVRALDGIEVRCTGPEGRPVNRVALDFAGTGLAADLLALTPARWKRFGRGQAAYAAGFFRALAASRPVDGAVRVDGWRADGAFAAVVVANQPVSGGGAMRTGPGARPDDGRLNVSVIRALGRMRMALQFLRLVRGTHVHHPAVAYREGAEVEVTTRVPVGVAADGDVLGATPASFRVRPGGVRVVTGERPTI